MANNPGKKMQAEDIQEQPVVRLNNEERVVVIKDMTIASRDVYDFLAGYPSAAQMEEEVRRAIEIGVAVIQKVQLVSDTDYFDKRIEHLNSRFMENLGALQTSILEVVNKSFDPAEATSYTRQLNDFFSQQRRDLQDAVKEASEKIAHQKDELETLIGESFDADDKQSHLGKLVERISTFERDIEEKFDPNVRSSITSKLNDKLESIFSNAGSLAAILDQRLSVSNPESPLVKFKEEIRKEIADLRIELVKQATAIETEQDAISRSPEKGYVFEERVFEALQAIARPYGDVVADVSKEQGETNRKSGDFTYDVSSLGKAIVVEARSRTITSVMNALADLSSSKQNRAADYGIYVVEKEDQLQKQIGPWNEYSDNRIITHAGLLEVSIKVARARLALEQPSSTDIDVNEIRVNLDKILDSLKRLSSIKRQATTIRTSSNQIDLLVAALQDEVQGYAAAIEEELSRAGSTDGEAGKES